MIRSNLEEKRVYSIDILYCLRPPSHTPSSREVRVGTEGRNRGGTPPTGWPSGLLMGSCLPSFLLQPRTTCPENSATHTELGWCASMNCQANPQQMLTHANLIHAIPQLRLFFQMILGCVKSKSKLTRTILIADKSQACPRNSNNCHSTPHPIRPRVVKGSEESRGHFIAAVSHGEPSPPPKDIGLNSETLSTNLPICSPYWQIPQNIPYIRMVFRNGMP